MVQGNRMDLSLFQFDYDMSFAVFFLNADRTIYGRYGTRSNRPQEAHTDISLAGLAEAMRASLALHAGFPANRKALQAKTGLKPLFAVPESMPGLREKFGPELATGDKKAISQSCIHCHQIRDAKRDYYFQGGKPLPKEVMYPWPMPEVIGLDFDRQKRATIERVVPNSPAAAAGFEAGDEVLRLHGQPIISLADVQWVLHRAGPSDTLGAEIQRGGTRKTLQLALAPGWREKSDISWRVSSWALRRIATGGILLESLPAEERAAHNLGVHELALFAKHVGEYGKHAAAKRAGFRKGDIIVSFDGVTKPWRETDLFAHVLENRKIGDQIPVTVLRGDKRINLTLPVQD